MQRVLDMAGQLAAAVTVEVVSKSLQVQHQHGRQTPQVQRLAVRAQLLAGLARGLQLLLLAECLQASLQSGASDGPAAPPATNVRKRRAASHQTLLHRIGQRLAVKISCDGGVQAGHGAQQRECAAAGGSQPLAAEAAAMAAEAQRQRGGNARTPRRRPRLAAADSPHKCCPTGTRRTPRTTP